MSKSNKPLVAILVLLAASVLLTGGLALHLALTGAREGDSAHVARTDAAPQEEGAAPFTGEPRVVFVSDVGGTAAVYAMEADGSDQRQVSASDHASCGYISPSPDGRFVAYPAVDKDRERVDIWVAALDGSEQISVSETISDPRILTPAWSPDGTRLAFVAAGESSPRTIHIAWADGSGIERSIPLPGLAYQIVWSPAGDELLLVSDAPDAAKSARLLSLDDEEIVELYPEARTADWSPDGEQVVVGADSSQEVVIVGPDQEPRQLVQLEGEYAIAVAWSPDGARIAVATDLARRHEYATILRLIAPETGETVTVVEGDQWLLWPDWSPDGERLLFTMGEIRWRPGADLPYAALWVYDVASEELEQLTTGGVFEGFGAWAP